MSTSETQRSRTPVLLAATLLVACAASAVFYGVSWASAANDESIALAVERDQVLQAGQTAVINFNTLDHRNVGRGLDLWEASSTGPLHDEVVRGRQSSEARIKEARSSTHAQVLDSAVTALDQRAGKATMIAVVQVTVMPEGQPPAQKRSRYQAELNREGDEWKLSGLGPVPVG
jgi:Mce-associated membrane protein